MPMWFLRAFRGRCQADRMEDPTQIDDNAVVLKREFERRTNSAGDGFSLYSLQHDYAVMALRDGIGIVDVAATWARASR